MFKIIHPNRWFFWTIAILLGFSLILYLFIFQSIREFEQQAIDSVNNFGTNWRIFHSQELGISIKYPSLWQVEIDPTLPNSFSLENPKNFYENISVFMVEEKMEKIVRNSLEIASEKKILVSGLPGVLLLGKAMNDPATSKAVLVKNNGKLYYIAGQAKNFEKIAASIKFSSK